MVRLTGSAITVRREGVSAEYIEFRSGDRRMADDYGVAPAIAFDEGFERLRAFVSSHSGAAVRG